MFHYRQSFEPTPVPGRDELPRGECRFISLDSNSRGQRCACVAFTLNTAIPGSSCECGHFGCYHITNQGRGYGGEDEIMELKSRVAALEKELDRERNGGRGTLRSRLRAVEDLVDGHKADTDAEFKKVYRGLQGLWANVGNMQKVASVFEDRIDGLLDLLHSAEDDMRAMQKRLVEIDDATMRLEDRLDADSVASDPDASSADSPRTEDTSDTPSDIHPPADGITRKTAWNGHALSSSLDGPTPSGTWTVHVSLLPTASQPFPFEKDTVAYKRCLSRGLHRVVAIPGPDSNSFVSAISNTFVDILKGRPWIPLTARICDAKKLEGLPMLRQLPDGEVGMHDWNLDFLKKNCASPDANGKIADLYIAMRFDVLRWSELRSAPKFLPGLERCWDRDPLLDGDDMADETSDSPEVGERAVVAWSPKRLKRDRSEISRCSSSGSAEGENKSAAKVSRQCLDSAVELSRRAETA